VLRRAILSRRQASRGVAGPAPPLSWHTSAPIPTNNLPSTASTSQQPVQVARVSSSNLVKAADFFPRSHSPASPTRLSEYCLHAILRYLDDPTPLDDETNPACTVGWAMREQVVFLETHLKVALLDVASMLHEGHPSRLSDRSIRAILATPRDSEDAEDQPDDEDGKASPPSSTSSGWDIIPETQPTVINHLPLTLHPSTTILLRQVLTFPSLSLLSLNLAYSTIDFEKVVTLLPAGLRELGLCGVRPNLKVRDLSENWRRGLSMLGRKCILLTVRILNWTVTGNG
jgi:hypothetical protein